MKRVCLVAVVMAMGAMLLAGSAQAGGYYGPGTNWANSADDCGGTPNLHDPIDDFADRFAANGMTSSNSGVAAASIAAGNLGVGVIAKNLSNDVGQAYVSNLVVKAGGTVTVPADSVAAASIGGNIAIDNLTNAIPVLVQSGTFTNGQPLVAYPVVFGSLTAVVCGWAEDSSGVLLTNAAISATSADITNFVPLTAVGVAVLSNGYYIATGTR